MSEEPAADLFGNPEPTPTLVRLERDCDRGHPCHDNLAFIRPSKGPHAGELRCAQCDRHRGWLPKQALDFLNTTAARLGAPSEPIILRTTGANKMTDYNNENRGALFRNDQKEKDADRDYAGTLNVEGVGELWVSGWVKISKAGTKYLSLSVKPKETADKAKPKTVPFDDEISF